MELKILTAKDAHDMSQKSISEARNCYLNEIFEKGINPAINKGEFKCVVNGYDIFPKHIVEYMQQLGYKCEYGKKYDQRDGEWTDETKLLISW